LEQAVAQTQTRLAALAEDEKKMREKRAEVLAEAQRLEKQSGALAESATARCPVCESELTSEHRDELLARNAQRSQELRAQGQVLDNGLAGCADEAGALRAALARDQQQLRSLPTQASLQQAEEALTLRAGAWERVQAEVTALRDAPVRHEALQQALAALNDPRHEYQRGEDQVRQRPAKEHESQQVGARERELAGSMAAVEGELATCEGLDETVRAMQTLRNQHREAHNTFIANHNAAQQLAARQGQVERLSAEVRAHSERLDAANAQHTQAMGGYDATRHDLVHQQVNSRQQEVAGGSAQEQEKHRRLDAVRQELEHLTTLRHELQGKQAQEQSLRELYALVEMIRDLLRRAGPYITRHLVRQISWDASNFYSDIIGDPSAQLQWSEDYELWLEVKGLKRTFRQLSGGEQMAAALALRLALLRLNSGVDVAFFDEPTAHLDPERRDGLAEKIMQVKGFSQLFVISHDDTFERAAQSYVRIVKDEAGSHAEEG
jgi:exonuclease SbcC